MVAVAPTRSSSTVRTMPEVMSLSANGSSSVFLRDRGNIRMDMTGVEVLDLAALGGADSVTIDDMSRTPVPPGEHRPVRAGRR